jgi:hypothetical protein
VTEETGILNGKVVIRIHPLPEDTFRPLGCVGIMTGPAGILSYTMGAVIVIRVALGWVGWWNECISIMGAASPAWFIVTVEAKDFTGPGGVIRIARVIIKITGPQKLWISGCMRVMT